MNIFIFVSIFFFSFNAFRFQCTSLSLLWLDLFQGILFFGCYFKWKYFNNLDFNNFFFRLLVASCFLNNWFWHVDCKCCNFAELVISSNSFFLFNCCWSFRVFAEIILLLPLQFGWLFLGFLGSSVGKESTRNAGDPGSISGSGRSAGEGVGYPLQCSWASLVAQLVKNPPAVRETWVWFLGWEDPLEKGNPPQCAGLENSMDCIVLGSQRVGHDWVSFTFTLLPFVA